MSQSTAITDLGYKTEQRIELIDIVTYVILLLAFFAIVISWT
jgi:hypothetical protein